jgi:CDP-paratose 2-epimerase
VADQYVLDYSRVFGLRAAVFRMSCLYGPRQFGTEDQGWVAHFLISALAGRPITIYGDGYQVRDVLYVEDAVKAYLLGIDAIENVSGQAFNLGGGPENTLSLRELLGLITEISGIRPDVNFDAWRPGDQPWYVSNTGALRHAAGWQAEVGVREGLERLAAWLRASAPPRRPARNANWHEGRARQSGLVVRWQHLFRLPSPAPAAGIWLGQSSSGGRWASGGNH